MVRVLHEGGTLVSSHTSLHFAYQLSTPRTNTQDYLQMTRLMHGYPIDSGYEAGFPAYNYCTDGVKPVTDRVSPPLLSLAAAQAKWSNGPLLQHELFSFPAFVQNAVIYIFPFLSPLRRFPSIFKLDWFAAVLLITCMCHPRDTLLPLHCIALVQSLWCYRFPIGPSTDMIRCQKC